MTSALTSMWAWDNSVPPSQDARGRGYAPAAPEPLAYFCVQRGLRLVFLGAPWAADEGPVGAWFTSASAAVAGTGARVGVLGGDPGWLPNPALAIQWATTALRAAPTATLVQLDVEPWTTPSWTTYRAQVVQRWLTLIRKVRAALPPGVPLGVDTPWWLAHEPGQSPARTLLDEVLARCDRVAVVAFADHAHGPDGIISLAGPAVVAASAAGKPFTVGVETDTPEVAGGPQFTFYDEGPEVMEQQTAEVAAAFGGLPGYEGVTVEHHRAWRHLLGLDG
ncbi:hypothetical protein [Cellulomonas sp.]|uniref:hypothetical protein n=1 Tax=Cellulomonas sp. TaxID=40001 RepID=UPI001B031F4A|nr:hypothetical protein [Cellulomonas sp.]MBO9556458.1 hypothetical protein [Cellulomonas sp.]